MKTQKEIIYNEILVIRCKRGDKKAFEELISTWERRIFYYIRRLVSDEQDAWDLLQETWMKVLRGIGKLRDPQRLSVWLYRIARNTVVSHLRHEIHREKLTDDTDYHEISGVNNDIQTFEDAEIVHRGLDMISLAHREVLTLHFLEDMMVEEIAEVLEMPSGTVKSRLYYAKHALKKVLEEG